MHPVMLNPLEFKFFCAWRRLRRAWRRASLNTADTWDRIARGGTIGRYR